MGQDRDWTFVEMGALLVDSSSKCTTESLTEELIEILVVETLAVKTRPIEKLIKSDPPGTVLHLAQPVVLETPFFGLGVIPQASVILSPLYSSFPLIPIWLSDRIFFLSSLKHTQCFYPGQFQEKAGGQGHLVNPKRGLSPLFRVFKDIVNK